MDTIKIFCPATIANISCGFDILGLALNNVGDEMLIKNTNSTGIKITKITGQNLPLETDKNVAGVAAKALLAAVENPPGIEIEILKKIKAGSGIGSSAASAAGAVWGINQILGKPFTKLDLVRFAMEGEKLASGMAHADNVAPAIYGGFTLVRSYEPLDIISLPSPKELYATVIHPQIEIKTSDSRKILKKKFALKEGIKQWGNVGGLIAGLYKNDYDLIGRSLEDHIVEPIRSILIPGFKEIKSLALENGALGCGISGSGPSVFALSRGEETALRLGDKIRHFYNQLGVDFDIHISNINDEGFKILD